MADIASVAIGLKNFCSSVLYPNGTAVPSITGRHTIVQRGWLTETDITGQCSLKAGVDYVTITSLAGAYKRIGERLGMPWRSGVQTPCNVGITSAGNVVTITASASGAPTGIVGVRIVSDGMSSVASYAIAAADTAATIAAALAAQIAGATAVGASFTVPGSVKIETASTGHVEATRVTRRQRQLFQLTLWTADPNARDVAGYALDAALSGELWFPDSYGAQCLLQFSGSSDVDTQQTIMIFKRVFRFSVVFDTTQAEQQAQMLFWGATLAPPDGGTVQRYGDQPLF